jgi:hypothetical protein
MKKYITVWRDKGHTRKKVPGADLCDGLHWSDERLASGNEYIVNINPSLRTVGDKKQFCASISVGHRAYTYTGNMWYRDPQDGTRLLGRDRKISRGLVYGSVQHENDFDIHGYSVVGVPVSEEVMLGAMRVFLLARTEFTSIFRDDENFNNP